MFSRRVMGGLSATVGLAVGATVGAVPSSAQVPTALDAFATPDVASALASAKRTGQRVPLSEATTETSEYFATPEGDVVGVIAAGAVRFRRNGSWVPIDLTLRRSTDGSVAPAAHPDALKLSGARAAGAGDLASLGDGTERVTMGWQGSLPEPRLEGSKATYLEVMPGVDLVVQATPTGFEQFTVLKSAAAAKRVTEITLPLTGQGVVSASEDKHGRVRVRNIDGGRAAYLPTPLMWDSAKGRPPTRQVVVDVVNTVGAAARSTAGTGSPVTLRLKPDQKWLTSPDTVYPVVIDPQITRLTTANTTTVMKGYPTGWHDADSLFLGAWDSSLIARSFVTWDATALRGMKIKTAKVNFASPFSSSCDPKPWEVWTTDAASTDTSWTNQPVWRYKESTSTSTTCYDSWVYADATSFFQRAATSNVSTPTMGLRASSETDYSQYKQFWSRNSGELSKVPYAEVTYSNPTTGPGVSSATYREENWAGAAGTTGTFTFTPPASFTAASYLYGLNVNPPTTVVTAATNGSASVAIKPSTAGVQTLYVRARNAAGTLSAVTSYQFGAGTGVAAIGARPNRTMTTAESTALTQLAPLTRQFLQNRANEITGHYDNTAGIPMWSSQAALATTSAAKLRTEGDILLMDNLDYEVSAVAADEGMVQIVGDQANLWLREATTLSMPGDTPDTAYGHKVDRAFVYVRSGTTWALADQRLVSQEAMAPMTEPLNEFTPVIIDGASVDEPAPPAGSESDYNYDAAGPTDDEPITGGEPVEASTEGTDPIPDTVKVDGATTASFSTVGQSPAGFTTAAYSTTRAGAGGIVLAGTIPNGLCYSCMVKYARKYYKNYNSGYRVTKNSRGEKNDCTNFVSQALQAGGWAEDTGWYRSNSNWWYNKVNQTYSWGGAENWSIFATKRTQSLSSVWKAAYGDVVQADWDANGIMDHTMIVTKTDGYDVYLGGHSSDFIDRPLSTIIRNNKAAYPNAKYYAYRT
ncbi:amidase domain-containing protein [Actinoplanes sp. NPDC049668]|uniref:amidase domain-containing protein n=1 Tax=unclassified Actinoplanes TaxID=2626549 RepID=UPI0033B11DE7